MPSVAELTALYENFLVMPRPGASVCEVCFNLTDGYSRCYACAHGQQVLDAVVPISYSVGGEQLHHALACYKRLGGDVARRLTGELAAVLWRFLSGHEHCVASRLSGVQQFALVADVPSSDRGREDAHPLRRIVGELVAPIRDRYERLLVRSDVELKPREFDPAKYTATRRLDGEPVLLIDDTWTTGASAQSAAACLKAAGAGPVAAVVIGRHVNRAWNGNDRVLRSLPPFDWTECVVCSEVRSNSPEPG
jgi:hypothetical protein